MPKILYWFRQDLRISDNPALYYAALEGNILPVYILDNYSIGRHKIGSASKLWLHHSLKLLKQKLEGNLIFQLGNPIDILNKLVTNYNIDAIYWNRCYQSWQIERDKNIIFFFKIKELR